MAEGTMSVVAAAAFLLMNVQFSRSCDEEGRVLICTSLPPYFRPGYLTLMMYLRDFGEINSTVFGSSNLTSVTRLVVNSAGVTAVADGAFSSLQNLTRLSLNYNALTHISPSWFGRPAVLSELNLTGNQIEAVTESMLSGLVKITQLSLNNNKITSIAPNTFSSQTNLAELDLSDNKLTRISAQVFGSLGSTTVRLHRNPWDCTCDAEDSVASLKDLWSRSLLDAQMEVTCETPPPLRGKPVWNVSVCETPPSGTHTAPPKPTDAFSPVPASSGTSAASLATTSPTQPTAETKPSVRPKPTDTVTTTTLKTTTGATSSPLTPPSETRTSVQPKPSQTTLSEPSSNASCALVIVMAILCVLLPVLCFLALLHWRKRSRKIVIPAHSDEDGKELEEGGGSGQHQLPARSETRWPFTGPRAKSANAVLCRSSSCTSGKDHVRLQKETEAQAKDAESPAEGKPTPVSEVEAAPETQPGFTHSEERADAGRDLGENTETVPYLSIGTKPGDTNQRSTDSQGQRSLEGKVMGRISTWPLTATQWQARRKLGKEEERADVFTVWTQNEKFSSEMEDFVNKELDSGSDGTELKEGETEKIQVIPPMMSETRMMRRSESTKPEDKTSSVSEAHVHTDVALEEQIKEEGFIQDVAPGRRTEGEHRRLDCKPADNPSNKPSKSSNEAEQRCGPKGAAPNQQRGGSKAPSGGTSPDDETLLSGNEYAFMDLLHEVVQNNGRWTRERWKQIHVNRQRR